MQGDQITPRRARWLPRALAIAAWTATASGCERPAMFDPELLPAGTERVELPSGATAQVDLGVFSPGVGDAWDVIAVGDGDVLAAEVVGGSSVFGERRTRDGGAAGGDSRFAVELEGLDPGTSTVEVRYCYRTKSDPDCDQGPEAPVENVVIEVEVLPG